MIEHRHPRVGPSFFPGLVIVIIGVILLITRLGYVHPVKLIFYWPVLLIVLGLHRIFASREPGTQVWGGMIAIAGGLLLGQHLGYIDLDWSVVFPIVIIILGVAFLLRSLLMSSGVPATPTGIQSVLHEWVLFGGSKMVNTSTDFRGGELLAIFGGYQLDLTRTEIAGDEAVLKLTAVLGAIEVRVPEEWVVVSKGVPVFGGIEDKTLHPRKDGTSRKTLVISCVAVLGGIEIRN